MSEKVRELIKMAQSYELPEGYRANKTKVYDEDDSNALYNDENAIIASKGDTLLDKDGTRWVIEDPKLLRKVLRADRVKVNPDRADSDYRKMYNANEYETDTDLETYDKRKDFEAGVKRVDPPLKLEKSPSKEEAIEKRKTGLGRYGMNLLLALDQLGGSLLGVHHDETISSHLGKAERGDFKMPPWGKPVAGILNKIQPGHTANAIEEDEGFDTGRLTRKGATGKTKYNPEDIYNALKGLGPDELAKIANLIESR
jgi:hypothetical protein